MAEKLWQHPVPLGVLGKDNYFVFVWNGLQWMQFMGPFDSAAAAEHSLQLWMDSDCGSHAVNHCTEISAVIRLNQPDQPSYRKSPNMEP